MNGTGRLYRGTGNAMIGGVAAGLGNFFKVDPTIIRVAFLALALFSGGAFVLVYMLMWLLIPTAGSTATEPNQVVRENLDEIGARVRGFTGSASSAANGANGNPGTPASPASNGGAETPTSAQAQVASGQAGHAHSHHGANPMILIGIGVFFLLANMGLFRAIHWGMWWPILLIGLGAMMLSRRR